MAPDEARRAPDAVPRTARSDRRRVRRNASASRRRNVRSTRSRASSAVTTPTAPAPVTIVDAGSRKELELEVIVPVDDMAELGAESRRHAAADGDRPRRSSIEPRASIWPHVHPRLLELIRAHHTTLVFCNARRIAERLAAHLNDLAGEELVRARTTDRSRASSGSSVESDLKAGRLRGDRRDEQPRARHRHGHASISSCWSSRRARSSRGMQRIGRAGHQVGEPSTGKIFPKYRGDLLEAAAVVAPHARRARRGDALPAQPARRARAADRRRGRGRRVGRRRARTRWCDGARTSPSSPTTCSAKSLDMLAGRYPSDRFAGLAPARRVGPRAGSGPRARGRAAGRDRERRHDPRPRPVRRVPPRRRARRRARRGDGLREPRRRDVRARRVDVADRGDHVRPRRRHAGAGRAREDAVLEGRPARPSARARSGARRHGRASCASSPGAEAEARLRADGLDANAAANLRRVPRRAGRVDRRGSRRPHDRHRTLPRRDRRLARLHPHAVRIARARAVGARARGAARPRRHAGAGAVVRRRHHPAAARSARRHPARCAAVRSRRGRGARRRAPADHVVVRVALPRERGARRCCSRAAGPASARRCGSSASARPTCSRSRPATRRSRCCSRRRASACATCSTFRRCARCSATSGRGRCASFRSRRSARRRSRSRCCSGGSPSTCTKATHRSPNGARLRSRSIAICCATSSAPRSCASCSIPTCSPSSSSSCSASIPERARTSRRRPPRSARRPRSARPSTRSARAHRDATRSRGSTSSCRNGASSASATASPRPKTRPGCATRSARAARRVSRPRSPTRSSAPLDDLVARYARTHGPFTIEELAGRLGITERSRPRTPCAASKRDDRVLHGEFRPGGIEREWCDATCCAPSPPVARGVRHEIEPVDAPTFARFLPAWQGVGRGRRGIDALVETLEQLQGVAIPASVLERDVLPARVEGYRAGDARRAVRGRRDRVDRCGSARRRRRARAPVLPRPHPPARAGARRRRPTRRAGPRRAARPASRAAGASFWPDLVARGRGTADASRVRARPPLWDLVWAGEVTNDTFGPLRAPRRATERAPRAKPNLSRLSRLGSAGGRRAVVARRAAARSRADTDRDRPRAGAATARTARRRDPRRRAREGATGRLRRGVSRAARARGGGAGTAGLVRRRSRRRAVRVAGRGRPAAFLPDRRRRRPACRSCSRRPTPRSRTARPSAGPTPVVARRAPPARTSSSSTVSCAVYLERGGKSLLTFGSHDSHLGPHLWADALVEAHKEGRIGRLQLERIDDAPARTAPQRRRAARSRLRRRLQGPHAPIVKPHVFASEPAAIARDLTPKAVRGHVGSRA